MPQAKTPEEKDDEKLDLLLKSSGDMFADKRRDAVLSLQGLKTHIPEIRRKEVMVQLLRLLKDKNDTVRYASLET